MAPAKDSKNPHKKYKPGGSRLEWRVTVRKSKSWRWVEESENINKLKGGRGAVDEDWGVGLRIVNNGKEEHQSS